MTTDAELYRRWATAGDRQAGEELIDRHTDKLMRYLEARTVDAADIAQATWEVALRSKSYAGRGSFQGWLQRVASSQLRGTRTRTIVLEERTGTTPSREVLRAELAEAVDDLSHEGQRAAMLLVLEGHGPEAIAGRLDVPVKTVWSRMKAATEKLRERLA